MPFIEFGTHIKFVQGPSKPKTYTWWVINKYEDIQIGTVAWITRWRKYGFYPKPGTIFEQVCLREISNFCEKQNRFHKEISGGKNVICKRMAERTSAKTGGPEAEKNLQTDPGHG